MKVVLVIQVNVYAVRYFMKSVVDFNVKMETNDGFKDFSGKNRR